MPFRFSRILYLSFGNEIEKRKRNSLQPCKFLTDHNSRSTIDRVYCFFAEQGGYYRSYDAEKNYLRYELTYLNKQIHTS